MLIIYQIVACNQPNITWLVLVITDQLPSNFNGTLTALILRFRHLLHYSIPLWQLISHRFYNHIYTGKNQQRLLKICFEKDLQFGKMKGHVENQTVNQLHMVNFTLNRLVCATIQALKFHTKNNNELLV